MKTIDILGMAISNMRRSKVRTILTIVAIFIGAFTITLTIGISSGVSSYIDKQVGSIGGKDLLIIRQKVEVSTSGPKKYDPNKKSTSVSSTMSSMLTDKDVEIVKSEKGLKNVQPIILARTDYISGKNGEKYQVDLQPFAESMIFDYTAGTMPSNSSDKPQIMVTPDYVKVLGYNNDKEIVGKEVVLAISTPLAKQQTVTATVTGVNNKSILSVTGLVANNALINKLYKIQTEGLPADVTNKYIEIVSQFDLKNTTDEQLKTIKDNLGAKGYRAVTVDEQIGIIKNVIDAITYVLIAFGAIALLAASFGIINTLYMSVQERTKEIGLMKAMGMSRSKVFLLFSVEAILLGLLGSIIGVIAAMGVGNIANKIASDSILKDLPGFDLTTFPVLSVVIVMFVVILIAFLAGALPARRAAKLDPIEALRYE
ncbi:MAG: FtsX-like permease family protein [Candidatus Saccharibacteria bacterium]